MTRVTSQTGEALLKALGSIYVACCLSCRHIAVRYNETRSAVRVRLVPDRDP